MAIHLRQPIFSFKKIIAKIHEKIGTAWEITVTSATGSLWKARKNIIFPVNPARPLKKCRVGLFVLRKLRPPSLYIRGNKNIKTTIALTKVIWTA